jgi:hypothetical protein
MSSTLLACAGMPDAHSIAPSDVDLDAMTLTVVRRGAGRALHRVF